MGHPSKGSRIVLSRISHRAKQESQRDLTLAEHEHLYRKHSALADKYDELNNPPLSNEHRRLANRHLRVWLEAKGYF
jgi:hypothetical protein